MGGPDATPDLWKQPFSAVRASGGYPGNGVRSQTSSEHVLTVGCTLLVKLHIIFSRMQRVDQHARPSIIQVGCPTCCYQVCALDHANVGTAGLDYSSGPCHRNAGEWLNCSILSLQCLYMISMITTCEIKLDGKSSMWFPGQSVFGQNYWNLSWCYVLMTCIMTYRWNQYCWLLKMIIICGKRISTSYHDAWCYW